MKILEIQQNSEEWLEFRKGKSGGSEFKDLWFSGLPLKSEIIAKLEETAPLSPADKKLPVQDLAEWLEPEEIAAIKLEKDPKKRFYEIIAERVARPITENDYREKLHGQPFSMMARGHILEPEAKAKFCEKTGEKLDQNSVVWISEKNPNIYISPDATITDKDGKIREAVEIKCPNSAEIVKSFLENDYPHEYDAQISKYFIVNEDLEELNFVLYTDVIPGLEIQIFEIPRKKFAAEIAEARIFEEKIMQKIDEMTKLIEERSF